MIGVVVWSNTCREKAVIWCEDQAELAYLQGAANLLEQGFWPQPGDLLELECEMIGTLRHARNVSRLSGQRCPELPRLLHEQAEPKPEPHLRLVVAHPQPKCASNDVPKRSPRFRLAAGIGVAI